MSILETVREITHNFLSETLTKTCHSILDNSCGTQHTTGTVSSVDTRPLHPPTRTAPEDDGATALRDWRIAEYESRLQNSKTRASAAYDAGCRDPDLVATTGAETAERSSHGYLLHPDRASRPSRLAADTWTVRGPTTNRGLMC